MIDSSAISDFPIRRVAETTFDQNVVVVAGAGTGKTTLLVNRLLNTLLREPDPVPITEIVALTFTNKAATEMKVRLQEQLVALSEWDHVDGSRPSVGCLHMSEFQERYGLSVNEIQARARAALDDIEKAQIGTLHSFSAHLLRLHPLECGVSPTFQEDDGTRFDEYFSQQWTLWIDHELNQDGEDHEQWKKMLSRVRLEQVRELAFELCQEAQSVELLLRDCQATDRSEKLKEWLIAKRDRMRDLLTLHERPKRRNIEKALSAAEQLATFVLSHGPGGVAEVLHEEKDAVFVNLGKRPSGWTQEDFAEAGGLIRLTRAFYSVDAEFIRELLDLMMPFTSMVQQGFANDGWVTFQGLLIRARSLLRDHAMVRERLKHEYRAILVDEFQDTDPLQYEIVLYLCEQPGASALHWQDISLSPGKLFIVGDPKQSIYAFRGADLEAFEHVVETIVNSGGVLCELATNFRSHGRVLSVVNETFNRLFQVQKHVQPANIQLTVRPDRQGGLDHPGVEVHLVQSNDSEEADSATITRYEAEQLAGWVKHSLLGGEQLTDANGQQVPLRPGHIGVLFRKLTQAHVYLEAFQRHGVPYVTDGEKHFYRRQEVIDFVNLLRVVANPQDLIGMLGVLRSSLGGLNDREIYEVRQREAFDYRAQDTLDGWENSKNHAVLKLYKLLCQLHAEAFSYSLGEVVDHIFSRLPIIELAAASAHGEQAVANLMKVRMMIVELAGRPHLTFTGLVNLLIHRVEQQPSEAERALVEESLDAVRVLTIHKAKGLEFPVVILPGFHQGAQSGYKGSAISYDWSTGVSGISIGDISTLGAVVTNEKGRVKEEAEQTRLLYVAMTRARERLIISGGAPARLSRGAFLGLLQQVTETEIGSLDGPDITIGSTSCPQIVTPPSGRMFPRFDKAEHQLKKSPNLASWFDRWRERDDVWRVLNATPTYNTPTSQERNIPQVSGKWNVLSTSREKGALIGTLTHRVLEGWNFAHPRDVLEEQVHWVCQHRVPREFMNESQSIVEEVTGILNVFISSPIYDVLQRAECLGREVPFTLPWDCRQDGDQAITDLPGVMEGVIDLVYQLDGRVYLADYKTDHVAENDLLVRSRSYQRQMTIYQQAAQQCLGFSQVTCQLIFLRLGKTVDLSTL